MAKRGTCSVCNEDVAVTKTGNAMKHGYKCGHVGKSCEGSGKPVSEVKPKGTVRKRQTYGARGVVGS